MDTRQLEFIVAIAEESNITKAAERMFVSQPALSQLLRNLEQELGTPLFIREGRTLRITKAGQIYLNGARSILNINKSLDTTVAARKKCRLTVCITGAVPPSLTLRAIRALRELYPDSSMEIKKMPYARAIKQLLKGYCELVVSEILEGEPEWPLVQLPLATQRMCLFHKKAADDPSESFNGIILSPPGTALRKMEDSLIVKYGIKASTVYESFDKAVAADMVKKGWGCAFLMESMAEELTGCYATNVELSPQIRFSAIYNPGILNLQSLRQII